MAKALVSAELVFETASQLVQEGIDPSIVNVQTRIGGGSYTTVKKYLDEWKKMRVEKPIVEVPPEIAFRGNLLVTEIWSIAYQLADRSVQTIKEQTQAEVDRTQQELAEAINELHRLERTEEQLRKKLASKDSQVHNLELKVTALEVEAKKAQQLQSELETSRTELARQQQQLADLQQQTQQTASLETLITELRSRFGQETDTIASTSTKKAATPAKTDKKTTTTPKEKAEQPQPPSSSDTAETTPAPDTSPPPKRTSTPRRKTKTSSKTAK